MAKSKKLTGIICGIGAAICYGTNPLGALKLYAEGMTTGNVLFWRFGLAWAITAILMAARRESVKVTARELRTLVGLGLLFIASSLTLYLSFHLMAAGVASTILFVYPVLTAAIMSIFFKERLTLPTAAAIALSFVGVVLLYWSDNNGTLSTLGVILVLISALTYAVYIIVMDRADLNMSAFKINFYVLFLCAASNLLYTYCSGDKLQMPQNSTSWFYVAWLAVVPAILALTMMVYAAKYAGSTPTAIMGALEPLTAVMIGVSVFGEPFTPQLAAGIMLILTSVIIIALRKEQTKQRDKTINENPPR